MLEKLPKSVVFIDTKVDFKGKVQGIGGVKENNRNFKKLAEFASGERGVIYKW